MDRPIAATFLALTIFSSVGCASYFQDRLLFVEETHLGLIARVSPDETSPADIDFGYRRTIVTLTPQKSVDATRSPDQQRQNTNGEIMSVISAFTAKIRWFESTEIHTYFATGDAATNTGMDAKAIKSLTDISKK